MTEKDQIELLIRDGINQGYEHKTEENIKEGSYIYNVRFFSDQFDKTFTKEIQIIIIPEETEETQAEVEVETETPTNESALNETEAEADSNETSTRFL